MLPKKDGKKRNKKKKVRLNTSNKGKKKAAGTKRKVVLEEKRSAIPDYFSGIRILLDDAIKNTHSELIRYFIAYGGIVLTPDRCGEATHVVHLYGIIDNPTIMSPSSARHVVVDWIQSTIDNKSLQDYRPYTVRWDPMN